MTIFKYGVFGKVVDYFNTKNFAEDTYPPSHHTFEIRRNLWTDLLKTVLFKYFEIVRFPMATMFYKIVQIIKTKFFAKYTGAPNSKQKQLWAF